MKHNLRITLNGPPGDNGIVRCKTLNVRERLMTKLFGGKQRLTVIVPGDSVDRISIEELGRRCVMPRVGVQNQLGCQSARCNNHLRTAG